MGGKIMKRTKQVESNSSGIFHVINEPNKTERESPGGYFIEKSRKTELYRLKAKEEIQFHKEEQKKATWWQKVKTWFNS